MAEKRKPITPYQRLMEDVKKFAFQAIRPRQRRLFFFRTDTLANGWDLTSLYERAKAADQLDYDVVVEAKDDGLHMAYRKRPDIFVLPFDARP